MKQPENALASGAPAPANRSEAPPPRPSPAWARLLVYGGLMLLSLTLTGSFLRPDQCQTRGCSPSVPDRLSLDADLLPADALKMAAQGQYAEMWLEIGDTGVFTPTVARGGTVVKTDEGQTIRYLDDLATKGYLAIRVPHAPPTYTLSSLLPGIPPGEPDPVTFNYYMPPSATELTTAAVTLTRRADLEAIVNAQYPIVDGQSHWEVWWLPPGETFPIPDQPFRLDADSWPPPLGLRFRIDFGSGSSARDCAGCPIEVLAYNGYLFVGPYPFALRYINTDIRDPLVSFGVHCGSQDTPVFPTMGQYITPTVPFTHAYCLENWDIVSRTFTIDAVSSQGWDYAYFWQGTEFGAVAVPAGDPPFTVEVGPIPNGWEPGTLGLLAMYTPTIAVSDTVRETLYLTATSTISLEVKASSLSVALAPGYTLDEGVLPPQYHIYLPLVLRSYP
jgi:hypothetical protein